MRKETVKRSTKETTIECSVNIDGTGINNISTKIGRYDKSIRKLCVLKDPSSGEHYASKQEHREKTRAVIWRPRPLPKRILSHQYWETPVSETRP